jgi:hypothetical protein
MPLTGSSAVDYQISVPTFAKFLSFLYVVVVVNNLRKAGGVDDAAETKTVRPVRIPIYLKVNTGRLVPLDAKNTC